MFSQYPTLVQSVVSKLYMMQRAKFIHVYKMDIWIGMHELT